MRWRDEFRQPLFPTQWALPTALKIALVVGAILWCLLLALASNAFAQERVLRAYSSARDQNGIAQHLICNSETVRCAFALERAMTDEYDVHAGPLILGEDGKACFQADMHDGNVGLKSHVGKFMCFTIDDDGGAVTMSDGERLIRDEEFERRSHESLDRIEEDFNPWSRS